MPGTLSRTTVGIVGAGPAGLMTSHLLARAGIDSVVVDHRTRAEIAGTQRAGILEAGSARLLTDTGVSDRVRREGRPHAGITLRFGGESHRVDFHALVGENVWLYPQTDVFADLAAARERDGGDVRYGVTGTRVTDLATDRPGILFTDAEGVAREVRCAVLVGADGSRGVCRAAVPEAARTHFSRTYPFAWFGVLVQAPPSADELVYTHSARGFALVSRRTESVQRLYFQCDPDEDPAAWGDDRIWAELQARVRGADGFALAEGPVLDRSVLRFRSFVCEPPRHGNMLLAGDAAHTVPPTGAKGLNLALSDARLLAETVERALATRDFGHLDAYGPRALRRAWRAQHFSYRMTTLLHRLPDASPFDERRQLAELSVLVGSEAASAHLAEGYTGLLR
ncbi:4-hydroxybenzoate 3-monooxygenase [Streptomyces huiliensis]|uniref:4-hydroxybenzoate 3-monooxygenase n=1 Tax=Streptomyces huiliensis TaxID=2876027 RepID=UPI001CC17B4D|nr:4-hydroxybenzoate 3-monooxygenase [Streptomyces huiliensis]MBZ4318407.1 4-hydroxybenzoate 3-monooxygenase [Streptomyces huiliensis]